MLKRIFILITLFFISNTGVLYASETDLQSIEAKIEKEQTIQSQINETIETEQRRVEDLEKLGYTRYNRDTSSDMYKIENSDVFYMSPTAIYILYPYGNENLTNDLDMIIL